MAGSVRCDELSAVLAHELAHVRAGDLVWTITDGSDGVVFDEQINTDQALEWGEPLGGPRPSLRRWLFFRAGHKQVMTKAVANLAGLVG